MKKRMAYLPGIFLLMSALVFAQKVKTYEVRSQNGDISVAISAGPKLSWSVQHKGQQIIAESAISLQLETGILGDKAVVTSTTSKKVNQVINAINYKKRQSMMITMSLQ